MRLDRHPELVKLDERFKNGKPLLSTADGLRWQNRMRASDAYFRDYSSDWESNQELLVGFASLIKKYGTYLAIGYAIFQNLVADTYFRNPDPLIQDKKGNRDLSRILSDVAKAIHADVDSEAKMKRALLDPAWAGFGVLRADFAQEAEFLPEVYNFATKTKGAYLETKQRVLLKYVSPWHIRFDPEGREWDLSDHSFIAILYYRRLSEVMADGRISEEDKERVMAWWRSLKDGRHGTDYVRYADLCDLEEDDPERIRLPFWHIWDRVSYTEVDQPLDADFVLTPQPWPVDLRDADRFPVEYIARNRDLVDKNGTRGFIGIPDARLIKPNLFNLQRYSALLGNSLRHVVNKYLSPKGALDDKAKHKVQENDAQFEVIEYDKDVFNAFPAQMQDKLNSDDILKLIPQAQLKELHHFKAIEHELNMIAQIIGQASADRGGLSDADSATESRGMQQRLAHRLSTMRHEAGKHYNNITELFFIILKSRQTLPLRYQMTTTYNEKVWAEFAADDLRELDLHFEYAVGSSEPKTREEEFALLERATQILMPMLQARGDTRAQMKLAVELVSVLGMRDADRYFNDEALEIVKQLMAIEYGLQKGDIPADDMATAAKKQELLSALLNELGTEQDIAEVMASRANQNAPAPEGEGALPSAPTAGEAAYDAGARGAANAGAMGGMQ
jgi:hypothetical protein